MPEYHNTNNKNNNNNNNNYYYYYNVMISPLCRDPTIKAKKIVWISKSDFKNGRY